MGKKGATMRYSWKKEMSRLGTQIKNVLYQTIIYILNYFSLFPNLYHALAIQLILFIKGKCFILLCNSQETEWS